MASIGSITSNANGLSFSGLATGIDTDSIINGLTSLNQQSIADQTSRETTIKSYQATFTALEGQVADLQTKTNALARSVAGAFDGHTADSSDSTAMTAAAGSTAAPGTYSITINALAQSNQIASQGFSDPNAQLLQGTMQISVGTGTPINVTLDSRNNSLQGLADAINAAGGDVRASIVNDGSTSPYRLMLTSSKTGAANAIAITNNLTNGTGASIDPKNQTIQAASDASVTMGSGTGALTVTSSTNQVSTLVPGVTINLLKANSSQPVTLTVGNDTATASQAIQDFVTSFNAVVDSINQQSTFDSSTQTAGPLLGNPDASGLKNSLDQAMLTALPGLNPAANGMSSVGLSFDTNGELVLDQGKLDSALSGATGATPSDFKRLFGLTGTSDNPGVSFVLGTDQTKPSVGSGYQVQVTSPATRATIVATGPPGQTITISPPNNTLLLKLNGLMSSNITLDSGTYTPDQLVALLQQKINANTALNGNVVSVGLDPTGKIQISSQQYGSASQVAIAGGTALSALGFSGSESASGSDVAGNFVVNGKIEAANGSGQTLFGANGNANTSGMQVKSTLSAPGTANLTVTQGMASQLNQVLNNYLDPTNGRFKTIDSGYQDQIDDIDKTIAQQNSILNDKTDQLRTQFAAMEAAVSKLQGVQSQLSSFVSIPSASSK